MGHWSLWTAGNSWLNTTWTVKLLRTSMWYPLNNDISSWNINSYHYEKGAFHLIAYCGWNFQAYAIFLESKLQEFTGWGGWQIVMQQIGQNWTLDRLFHMFAFARFRWISKWIECSFLLGNFICSQRYHSCYFLGLFLYGTGNMPICCFFS